MVMVYRIGQTFDNNYSTKSSCTFQAQAPCNGLL